MSRTLLLKLYVQTGSRFVFVNSTSFYPLIGSTPCSKAPATSNARTELRVMVKYTYTLKDAEGHLQKSRVSLLLKHLAVLDSCMPTLTVPRSWWDLAQGSKPSPTADLRSVLDFQFAMGTWFQSIWSAKRGVPSSDMRKICKRLKLGKPHQQKSENIGPK